MSRETRVFCDRCGKEIVNRSGGWSAEPFTIFLRTVQNGSAAGPVAHHSDVCYECKDAIFEFFKPTKNK